MYHQQRDLPRGDRHGGTGLAASASAHRPSERHLVGQAITALLEEGPSLGRPLVDRIKGSALHNLKELRPGSTGASEIRILFIFDPARNAVLLIAGDKAGRWDDWYRASIPLAETRYAIYLKEKESS
jgi:hypothetical protein